MKTELPQKNIVQSRANAHSSEDTFERNILSLPPPALQLQASQATIQLEGGPAEEKPKTEETSEKKEETTATGTGDKKDAAADKSITLSAGFLHLANENGSVAGASVPHLPANLRWFEKGTAETLKGKKVKFFKKTLGGDDYFVKSSKGTWFTTGGILSKSSASLTPATQKVGEAGKEREQQLGLQNGSGVTIGFGYDIGTKNETEAKALLKQVIKDTARLDPLIACAGKRGIRAVEEYRKVKDKIKLTEKEVFELLEKRRQKDVDRFSGLPVDMNPVLKEFVYYLAYWQGPGGADVKKIKKKLVEKVKDKGLSDKEQLKILVEAFGTPTNVGLQRLKKLAESVKESTDADYKVDVSTKIMDIKKENIIETAVVLAEGRGKYLVDYGVGFPEMIITKMVKGKPKEGTKNDSDSEKYLIHALKLAGYTDTDLNKNIRAFQTAKGQKADGYVSPGKQSEMQLVRDLMRAGKWEEFKEFKATDKKEAAETKPETPAVMAE